MIVQHSASDLTFLILIFNGDIIIPLPQRVIVKIKIILLLFNLTTGAQYTMEHIFTKVNLLLSFTRITGSSTKRSEPPILK